MMHGIGQNAEVGTVKRGTPAATIVRHFERLAAEQILESNPAFGLRA